MTREKRSTISDKSLIRAVRSFTKELLKPYEGNTFMMCNYVCMPLSSYLEFCGIPNTLGSCEVDSDGATWSHCYLQLSDGRILDPTANQFNNPHTGEAMPHYYLGIKPDWYRPVSRTSKT